MLLLILRWLLPLWLLGWLLLPLTRQIFSNLPDGGLAVGRTLTLVVLSLVAFWGASTHTLPLTIAPLLIVSVPLVCAGLSLGSAPARVDLSRWARENRSALLTSDAVFIGAFLFFLWVRLRHPEIGDLEKSMDAALIAALERAPYLPAENPWFSGAPFTNYYYFGHLMGALLARTFATPVVFSYNLIQPLFCALFIAPLWSLCAALTGSKRRGLVAMSIVALCGNFEPLRQWSQHLPSAAQDLFRLDWWSTSRVIPDTINEYPIFTMTIGDAHAHFFALALASAIFCCCYALFAPLAARGDTPPSASASWLKCRRILLLLLGALLGSLWMTNTWDLPLYALLSLGCAFWTLPFWRDQQEAALTPVAIEPEAERPPEVTRPTRPKGKKQQSKARQPLAPSPVIQAPSLAPDRSAQIFSAVLWALAPLPLARLFAAPYLHLFKPQFTGAVREFYAPPSTEFLLLWGGFVALWFVTLSMQQGRSYLLSAVIIVVVAFVTERGNFALAIIIAALALTILSIALSGFPWERAKTQRSEEVVLAPDERSFEKLMALCGLLALLAPMLFYIKGAFGDGQFRHMDTFFKFGEQAWLLLGTAAACGVASLFARLRTHHLARWGAALAWITLWSVPVMCAASVVWTRTVRDAPRDAQQNFMLSLDAAHNLTPADHAALQWLQNNAGADDTVLEAVGKAPDGNVGGDFDAAYSRVAALTGIPDPVGWPQHIVGWGTPWGDINRRVADIRRVYAWPANAAGFAALHQLGVRYVFVGATERNLYKPDALARLRAALLVAYDGGDTFIAEVPR